MSAFINPIIESMFRTANLATENRKLQEDQRRAKVEEQQRETQLQQAQQQLENRHEYEQALIKHEAEQNKLRANEAKMHLTAFLQDFAAKGGNISQLGPVGQPQAGLPSTGNIQSPGSTVDLSAYGGEPNTSVNAFPTAEDTLAREVAAARGLSAAQAEGKLPSELQLENIKTGNLLKVHNAEAAARMAQIKEQLASEEKRTGMSNATQLQVANIHANVERERTNLEYGGSPEINKGLTMGAMTGLVNLTPGNPVERNILQGIINGGYRPIDTQTGKALRESEKLIPVFDLLKDFAYKYLPSEKELGSTRAKLEGGTQGLISKYSPITTDAMNKFAEIKMSALNIAKSLEGLSGRPLSAQLDIALRGPADLGSTREQVLDRINNLKNMFVTQTQDAMLAGVPEDQKKLLYERGIITPPYLIGAPSKNSMGLNLSKEDSIRLGQPAYK